MVVTADHGEEFLEHGWLSHCRNVQETAIRVPLVLRLPGTDAARGGRSEGLVELLDVVPTILEAIGIEPPAGLEGRSLLPLAAGEAGSPRYVVSAQAAHRTVTDGRHKLLVDLDSGTMRLFDLAADPGETRDLVGAAPEKTRELLRELRRWIAAVEGDDASAARRGRESTQRLEALGYL